MPLRAYLARLIWLVLLPLLLLAAWLVVDQVQDVERENRSQAEGLATAIMASIDRSLNSRVSGLQMIAATDTAVEPGRLAELYRLGQAYVDAYGAHVIVADTRGQMLLNTRVPLGTPLPALPVQAGRAAAPAALQSGRPAVGDVFLGPVIKAPLVGLAVPIRRGDQAIGTVLGTLEMAFFRPFVGSPAVPAGWSVVLRDGTGHLIATTVDTDEEAQQPVRLFTAPSTVSGWTVQVSVPAAQAVDRVRAAILAFGLALVLSVVLGLLGGRAAGHRLDLAIGSLARTDGLPAGAARVQEVQAVRAALDEAMDARVRAEFGLRERERSYRLLFDAHPLPLWVFDPDTLQILAANDAAVAAYGWSHEAFRDMTMLDLRPPEERARQRVLLAAEGGPLRGAGGYAGVWVHVPKDGRRREVEVHWSAIAWEGRPARLLLAVDVTERAEFARQRLAALDDALRARNSLQETLARIGDGFVALDSDWRFTFVNERAQKFTRASSPEQLIGREAWVVDPQVRQRQWFVACEEAVASGQVVVREIESEIDGAWYEMRCYPAADGVSIYFTDTTARRRAEQALRASEARHRLMFEANPSPVWVYDTATLRFLAVNDAAVTHYGFSRDEFLAMTLADIRPPEDVDALRRFLGTAQAEAPGTARRAGVFRHRTRDGRLLDVEVWSNKLEFDGRSARLVLAIDVSERLRLERARERSHAALAAQRAQLDAALANMLDAVYISDAEGRFVEVNDAYRAFYRFRSDDEVVHSMAQFREHIQLFDTDSRPLPFEEWPAPAALRGHNGRDVTRIVLLKKTGERFYGSFTSAPIRDATGRIIGTVVTARDITQRVEDERALRESERNFRVLAEQMPAIVYRSRLAPGQPTPYVSPYIGSLGYTAEEWTSSAGPNWRSTLHPDDAPRALQAVDGLHAVGDETRLAYRLRDRAGQWHDFMEYCRVVEVADDGAPVFQGVMLEITELKRSQRALAEAEAYQRSLFESQADGVLLLDPELHVLDANPAAVGMLGYGRDRLLGRDLHELVVERDRRRLHEALADLLGAQNGSRSAPLLEWEQLRADGSSFPAEVSVHLSAASRVVAVVRDVSERRAAQRALMAYQMELSELTQRLLTQERETTRHVAQTLHDGLGQTLAAARLQLDAATVQMGQAMPPPLRLACQHVSAALDGAIGDVRVVLGELRPPMLEDQGLIAALDNEIRLRTLVTDSVDVLLEVDDGQLAARWPADVEYAAFMIAREAIHNAQLHAEASLVRVIVDGPPGQLELAVVDDGRGIPDELRSGRPGHLGIVGMRERAIAIGAQFAVEQPEAGGTRIVLRWQKGRT